MSKKKIIIIVILIAVIPISYFSYKKIKGSQTEKRYVVAEVEKGTITSSVSGSGNVESYNTTEISPDITGEISSIKVSLGNKVQKGDLLLTIDNDELESQRIEAWTSYLQSKDDLEKAKLDRLQAIKDLNDLEEKDEERPDSVSNLETQIAEKKVESANLAISSAKNKVHSSWVSYKEAKKEAEKRSVSSPMNGVITALNANVGDSLGSTSNSDSSQSTGSSSASNSSSSSTSNSIMTISSLGKLKADISLNEVDIAKVKKGQDVTLTFDAIEDFSLVGEVSNVDISGTVNEGVVTYNAEVVFKNENGKIKPGMTVSASIITEKKQDVLIIANSALKSQNDNYYIEVPKEEVKVDSSDSQDGIVLKSEPQQKTVKIGLANDTSTEIKSGLKEGDQIILKTISSSSSSSDSSEESSKTQQTQGLFQMQGGGVRPTGGPQN